MIEFTLRAWTTQDLDSLVAYANNSNIARFMMNVFPHPYGPENGKAFIDMAMKEPQRFFAIDLEGKAIGGIGLHPQQDVYARNAELGYWLAEPYWGKGIVTRAVSQMVKHGFEHFDITRIFARPFGNNPASQKVLEKAGFILEARLEKTLFKNGEYQDELIYAVRKYK
jgi:[ribosomal protein S5]-alanine N-acetyltransferase